MPDLLSQHCFPHPRLRVLITWALAAAIVLLTVLVLAQIGLALTLGPIFFGGALFSAILLIPLLMRTVLHPEVDIRADGVMLRPMLWPAQFVPWSALLAVVPHPLLYNDEALGRTLHGKNYRPREGAAVLVSPTAGLLFVYRILGGIAGSGDKSAFAISSTTHTDYAGLLDTIQRHITDSSKS